MKIAFDVDVIKDLGVTRMVHQVAEWGYKYIEQSPHPQINPFYKHPRASREIMAEYKQALRDTGVELSSFICVYRWSGPDELRRQAAVKNWKRLIEIAVEMGVQVINTEFSGDPNQPEICDGSIAPWKSCCRFLSAKASALKFRHIRGTSAKRTTKPSIL